MSRKKKVPPKVCYPQFSSLRDVELVLVEKLKLNVYLVFLDGAGLQFLFEAPSDERAIEYLKEQYRDNKPGSDDEGELLKGFRLMKMVPVAQWGQHSGLRVV